LPFHAKPVLGIQLLVQTLQQAFLNALGKYFTVDTLFYNQEDEAEAEAAADSISDAVNSPIPSFA
jgi:hypothetical protein